MSISSLTVESNVTNLMTMRKAFPLIIALVFSVTCQRIYGQISELPQNLAEGLDLSLSFSGNGIDDLGAHNATIVGATFTADRFGTANSALHFDGVATEIAFSTNLPSLTTTNVTLCAWIRPEAIYQISEIMGKELYIPHQSSYNNEQWTLYIQGAPNSKPKLVFGIKRNSQGIPNYGWYFLTSTTPLPAYGTNWVFVAATWDGTTANVYANGNSIGQTTSWPAGGIDTFPGGDVVIGRSPYDSSPSPFKGSIGNVKVYERALSAAEIQSIYQIESTPASAPADGLLAYYPFNNSAIDVSGNSFDGTPLNVVPTTNRFGVPNSAYLFTGTNSVVDLGNRSPFDFAGDFTLSIWACTTNLKNISAYVIGKYTGYAQDGYGLGFGVQPNAYTFAQTAGYPRGVYIEGGPSLVDGTWHHLVATFARTNAANLFVDGVLVGSDKSISNVQGAIVNNDHLFIGGITTGQDFIGQLDDARIYTRAISIDEVSLLYAYEKNRDYQPSSPTTLTNAQATAIVGGGQVTSITLDVPGNSYYVNPKVTLVGGGGSGAEAIAIVSNGVVTQILVTNPGFGYSSAPIVLIESPAAPPSMRVNVSSLQLTSSVTPGKNYILESSTNAINWSPLGQTFVANDTLVTNIVPATASIQLYRVRQLPTP
jgi:Concanavalin A-like lectin/glucanases superfamily